MRPICAKPRPSDQDCHSRLAVARPAPVKPKEYATQILAGFKGKRLAVKRARDNDSRNSMFRTWFGPSTQRLTALA
jgi:hypothetical protein